MPLDHARPHRDYQFQLHRLSPASHSPKQNGKYSHSAQLHVLSKLFTAQAPQQRKLFRKEKQGVGRSRRKAGNSFSFAVAS